MSPRVLELDRCPHCKTKLEQPTPRVCPVCAGSLQKRFLTAGCLTSAPRLLLFAVLCAWLTARVAKALGVL